jgi:hypothetical protein
MVLGRTEDATRKIDSSKPFIMINMTTYVELSTKKSTARYIVNDKYCHFQKSQLNKQNIKL